MKTFLGAAGQPRAPAQRRPNTHNQSRNRNTMRGIRSEEAQQRRREQRTAKRRQSRRQHRRGRSDPGATAQEPGYCLRESMKYASTNKFATLNARGVNRAGKREEIERWMKDHHIAALGLQETNTKMNTKEVRKKYTCFFSGERKDKEYVAGVGWVIENSVLKLLTDVIPISDRIILLRMEMPANMTMTLICAYAPQAERDEDFKEKFYDQLQSVYKKYESGGPTLIMADFNARVQTATSEEEATVIGQHTFLKRDADPWNERETVQQNRQMFMEMCLGNQLKVANTCYRKQEHKLVTYRKVGTTRADPLGRRTHEQIDYILVPSRWKNGVIDCEADNNANIDSDHNPVTVVTRFKLRGRSKRANPKQHLYDICTLEQRNKINKKIKGIVAVEDEADDNQHSWQQWGKQ